jgi:purine-binding chemotaxis protein CheW
MNEKNTLEKKEKIDKLQVTTFYIDNRLFGIPIADVLEINKNVELTPVPLAPPYIDGVINLRGQIVPAFNLRKRLGMLHSERDEQKRYHNVIVGNRTNSLSLLVDEIGDVLEISSDIIEPPPDTIKGMESKYVKNVCKLKGGLLVVLDSAKIQSVD